MELWPHNKHPYSTTVRPVLFHIEMYGDDVISSDGGTVVLIRCHGQIVGVTCKHVLNERYPGDLLIHPDLHGVFAVKPHMAAYLFGDTDQLKDSEIEDIMLVAWNDSFAWNQTQTLTLDNVIAPEAGDRLAVAGFLKDRMEYIWPKGKAFCFETEITDIGVTTADPIMRSANIALTDDERERSVGLSGGLVYNMTKQCPAGIILRASDIHEVFVLHYLPFSAFLPSLEKFALRSAARLPPPDFNFSILKKLKRR